ncbi:MAG TPA: hypothetical protein VK601_31000, partial [Kofleriaceae bacterium]|nr:hypothetical protein [Kofleriaceae bacterium]
AVGETPLAPSELEHAAPVRALRGWWHSGVLAHVLHCIDDGAAATLHDLVLGAAATAEPATPALLALAQQARAALTNAQPPLRDAVRQRIAIAAALLDAAPAATLALLRAAIDAALPIAATPACEPASIAAAQSPLDDSPVSILGADAPPVAIRRTTGTEIEIRSVLPFLLLPALHHAGWLDTASTLLAAHDLAPAAFALAAGLAAKVLDPLERGWSRSRADRVVIAAFCGTDEAIPDAQVAAAAARLRPILPALDAALRGTIARARRPLPLVLWRDDRGWLLLDTDGMVALATHAELRPVVLAAPTAPIIVPAAFADGATLEQIEFANARFLSDAPRSRDESWRMFAGLDRRMITNDTATPIPHLVAVTAGLDTTLALAEELAGALAERPAIPRHPLTAFEATCTLAATAALADLGARLFPAEPTTPVLALTRFRDLDARVRFKPDRVVVRVPLGRRHADLVRHGALGELARIPWLDGRAIDLGGA